MPTLKIYRTNSHLSYRLLRTGIPPTRQEIAVFENIMQQMRLHSGVYRTTFRGRFAAFDEFINRLLPHRFDANALLEIHDWAASDCLTSAEWAQVLFRVFPNARLHASDLTLHLIE